MQIDPFRPVALGTVQVTTSTSSAPTKLPEGGSSVEVTNEDLTDTVYVEFGGAKVVAVVPSGATLGSYPILPGQSKMCGLASGQGYMATIASANTPHVYASIGVSA